MNDRELLELAARAVGIVNFRYTGPETLFVEVGSRPGASGYYWQPLTDDGDALRLAVKLEINILPTMEQASCRNPEYTAWMNEDASRDPFAATRRAIVRAAAAIGEVMQ